MLVSTMNCCFSGSFSILFCVELALVVGPQKCRLKGCELESHWPKKGRTKHMFSLDILWPMDHGPWKCDFPCRVSEYVWYVFLDPGKCLYLYTLGKQRWHDTWMCSFVSNANSEIQLLFFLDSYHLLYILHIVYPRHSMHAFPLHVP